MKTRYFYTYTGLEGRGLVIIESDSMSEAVNLIQEVMSESLNEPYFVDVKNLTEANTSDPVIWADVTKPSSRIVHAKPTRQNLRDAEKMYFREEKP